MAPRSNAKHSAALDPALPQKKRARRRVVGALAVCVAAAIVLPVVLDSEPRQVRDDVQVQIPSRDTPISEPLPGAAGNAARDADKSAGAPDAKPDAVPDAAAKIEPAGGDRPAPSAQSETAGAAGVAQRDEARPEPRAEARPDAKAGTRADAAPAAPVPLASAAPVVKPEPRPDATADSKTAATPDAKPAPKSEVKADAKPAAKAEAKTDAKPAAKTEAKTDAKPAAKTDAKADPKLAAKGDAKADPKLAAKGDAKAGAKTPTYLLQIGAFASEKGAADQAQRARKAGLKAYTEKVQTPNGERIRVRVGPFGSREAANDARGKLRAIGVDAALIGP